MFCTLKEKTQSLSLHSHILATLASFAAFRGTQIYLDKLYAASGHPVDFATGQLAFNGEVIFGYYEAMRAGGTFGIYVQTQLFDFAFIASVIALGVCLGTLLARVGRGARLTGIGAAFFAFTGGTFDALENLMSFYLMQFEQGIPHVLALIYSSFAALKFASLTAAMVLVLCAALMGLISGGMRLMHRSTVA
ncbi:hypothetical protein [Planktotalea arctica]|uniref:hypothetical protein n=1 Tax=Planktotalea arctica TaxID=1481893 RepID=UPI003219184B